MNYYAFDDSRSQFHKKAKTEFRASKATAEALGIRLRKIAEVIGEIVKHTYDGSLESSYQVAGHLRQYAMLVEPWAHAVLKRMHDETAARDARQWNKVADVMGRNIRREIQGAPTGIMLQQLLVEQVPLITSLPFDAAQRVHDLTLEAIAKGTRPSNLVEEIMRTGHVTKSRATLIARTETARTASLLTQVRALHLGSPGYQWRAVMDGSTRPSHRKLHNTFHKWDEPPLCDPPDYHAHPGQIWNCFTEDTRVSLRNGIIQIWRTPFDDEIIDISTSFGFVSCTRNHPILTNRGWVSATEICEGDYLVQSLDDVNFINNSNKDKFFPTFKEVFSSLQATYATERKTCMGLHFYGDVSNTYVDNIFVDPFLSNDFVPQSSQGFPNLPFSNAESRIGSIGISSDSKVISSGDSGRSNPGSMFFRRFVSSNDLVSLCLTTQVASGPKESISNNGARDAINLSEPQFGSTGQIFINKFINRDNKFSIAESCTPPDSEFLAQFIRRVTNSSCSFFKCGTGSYKFLRVVDKSFRHYSGHVYTLETVPGWYSTTSTGIVVKNCRCTARVIFP